jgi:hypothetical protein
MKIQIVHWMDLELHNDGESLVLRMDLGHVCKVEFKSFETEGLLLGW